MFFLVFFLLMRMTVLTIFFFFSSRRRHTRSLRDWSSDVCSSDLDEHGLRKNRGAIGRAGPIAAHGDVQNDEEGMIENPGAAGGPLGFAERCGEMAVHIKTHHARL